MLRRRDILKIAGLSAGFGLLKSPFSSADVHTGSALMPAPDDSSAIWRSRLSRDGSLKLPFSMIDRWKLNGGSVLYVAFALFERRLDIYPKERWDDICSKIDAMPARNPEVQFFRRKVILPAIRTEIDNQGRLNLSSEFREDAKLHASEDIVTVDLFSKAEVWSLAEWNNNMDLQDTE